jgi:hypothetical protein
VLASTSAGLDISVGGYSCLARLVGLLLNWVLLVYRSSMFAFSSGRHYYYYYYYYYHHHHYYIFTGLFLSSSEYSGPEGGQPRYL